MIPLSTRLMSRPRYRKSQQALTMGRNIVAPLCTRGNRNTSPATPSPYESAIISSRLPRERFSQECGSVYTRRRRTLAGSGCFIRILPLTTDDFSAMCVFIRARAHAQIWWSGELIEEPCSPKGSRKLMSCSHQFAIAPNEDKTQVISQTRFFRVKCSHLLASFLLPFLRDRSRHLDST